MKLSLLLALLILWGTTQASTYTSVGKGVDEDCSLARALAINDALDKFSMRVFEASKKHVCKEIKDDITCHYQKEISSEAAGTFKQIISQDKKVEDDLCYLTIKIEVEKTKLLDVQVSGKDRYMSGDVLDLVIQTTEPLFVYVYNDYSGGLQKLYPHLDNKHELVLGTLKIIDNKDIHYRVYVNDPYEKSSDTLIIVFSKVRLTFKNRLSKNDFYDTIKAVPPFSRRVLYYNIEINRRSL